MKNTLCSIAALFLLHSAYSQEATLKLVSTAGQHIQNASGSVTFSIGEPVIGVLSGSGFTVSQGFQQGDQSICSIPGFNPLTDSIVSCSDSILLKAGDGFATYLWNNGSSTSQIHVKHTGLYTVTVSNQQGCQGKDTVFVSISTASIIENDTTICAGSSVRLSAAGAFSTSPARSALPSNLSSKLVAWYPLNGNANDLSDYANNGVVSNGPVPAADRFGNANGAYLFNGASGTIEAKHIGAHNTLPLSVSCWVRSEGPNREAALVSKYFAANWNGWQLQVNSAGRVNPWYIAGYDDNVMGLYGNPDFSHGNLYDGKWHHVSFTVDSTQGILYVDGRKKATQFWKGKPQSTTASLPLHIGFYPGASPFNGLVDEVFIHGRALTEAEVNQLYTPVQRYRWSTGDTTPTITVKPDKTTTYYLTVSNGISSCTDSVTVRVATNDGQTFNPFPNSIYSKSDSLKLDAGTGYSTYKWSTGASSQSIHVKTTGLYKVTVTSPTICAISDSVFVQFPDTVGIQLPSLAVACNGKAIVPVKASGFRHIETMQGSINWNADDMRFEKIGSFGPAALGLKESNFGTTQTGSGRLSFSWNDPNSSGVSLTDSTVLFTIEFSVLPKTSKSIPVKLAGNPTSIEFTDIGGVKKSVLSTGGSVDVDCDIVVSGRILSTTDLGLRNVTVTLSGGPTTYTQVTDDSGSYRFKVPGGSYVITPSKAYERDRRNGISTLDLAQIQSHILFRSPFNSAYKAIAADANQNASVTTFDILSLRRLILGIDTALPNNRIWTYVDAGQTFANADNPFPYNTTKTLTNQFGNVSQSFRGIKIGDVNYDRNPMLDQAPSGDTLRLYYEWSEEQDGNILLRLKSRAVAGILGYQTTLKWDAEKIELDGVLSNPTGIGFGERWKDDGYLTLSWNDPQARGLTFTDGLLLLEMRFRKTPRLDRTALRLDVEKLATEAFNANLQSVGVRLTPTEIKGNQWNGLLRIFPNPAGREVNIEWRNETRGQTTIRLLDATGRVAYVHRGFYETGVQRHVIHRDRTATSAGSYIVQVESNGRIMNGTVVTVNQEPTP